MTATLILDKNGQITLPEAVQRIFGAQAGTRVRAEVTRGRIELIGDEPEDVPLITEVSPDGLPVIPAGLRLASRMGIVEAIKSDREERIRKISGR